MRWFVLVIARSSCTFDRGTVEPAPERVLVVDLDDPITYSYRPEISGHRPSVVTFDW